jgi:N-formylglutamate amidohydrolase
VNKFAANRPAVLSVPMDAALPAPYRLTGASRPAVPVVVTVPHAGRYYPAVLDRLARVPRSVLERLEDRHADAIAGVAAEQGFPVLVASIARAFIDLNRSEDEWDSLLIGDDRPRIAPAHRVRAGLGLVPRRLMPEGELWQRPMRRFELEQRIDAVHRPWHGEIERLLSCARAAGNGRAVLIDLHSMPSQPGGVPQFIVGDRHGMTASSELVDRLLAEGEGAGLIVARNAPYAGAHTIQRHGRRRAGVEAVQIEFDRTLYLDAAGQPDAAKVARIGALVARLAHAAADHVLGCTGWPLAAE